MKMNRTIDVTQKSELLRKYRAEFENACDCLYYGYGYKLWLKSTRFENEEDANVVWKAAFERMANN